MLILELWQTSDLRIQVIGILRSSPLNLPGLIEVFVVHSSETIKEHKDSENGWKYQHLVIESQPGKV